MLLPQGLKDVSQVKQVPESKLQLGTEELLTSQQEDRKRGRNAGRTRADVNQLLAETSVIVLTGAGVAFAPIRGERDPRVGANVTRPHFAWLAQ